MYISNIKIQNYRGFQSLSVGFRDGINILIGPNNSGKSNLLKALSIIFDGKSRKQLTVADFYNGIQLEDLKKHSPKITITVMLSQSENVLQRLLPSPGFWKLPHRSWLLSS